MTLHDAIERDIRAWIDGFVTAPNAFYHGKFAPCPFARQALLGNTADVAAWRAGDPRAFVDERARAMRDAPHLTTRVLAFPPRIQGSWGFGEHIETLNARLIPDDVFLNAGIAKTTASRYPGSRGAPYFIVVANSLAAVLNGAAALERTGYYADWPAEHYDLVVTRRARLAARFGRS